MFQCEYSPDTFYQVSYRCIDMPGQYFRARWRTCWFAAPELCMYLWKDGETTSALRSKNSLLSLNVLTDLQTAVVCQGDSKTIQCGKIISNTKTDFRTYSSSFQCMDKNDCCLLCRVCQTDEGTIRIAYANYGRSEKNTCTDTPSKFVFCTSDAAQPAVKELCVLAQKTFLDHVFTELLFV